MPITRFGDGDESFTFDAGGVFLQTTSNNFSDLVTNTSRLPALDGSFDEYGLDKAPQESGFVRLTLKAKAAALADPDSLRDNLRAIARWGVRKLYMNTDAGQERFCFARLNNLSLPRQDASSPLIFTASLTFQVSYPAWLTPGTEAWLWGEDTTWGDGEDWGSDAAASHACAGEETAFTETVAGNHDTLPRISVQCGTAETASHILIQRLVEGEVIDEISWSGDLGNDDQLLINCRDFSVTLNGADAYAQFENLTPDWLKLEPGDNEIAVLMAGSGDACIVRLHYYEAWY